MEGFHGEKGGSRNMMEKWNHRVENKFSYSDFKKNNLNSRYYVFERWT